MRNRTRAAVALGALAAALALTGTLTTGGPGVPPARAAALTPFRDCDELLRWYVDRTIDQVGPWGWGGGIGIMGGTLARDLAAESSMPGSTRQTSPGDAVSNGPTGTNVQEAGIDEPDVAKTNGRIVVRLLEGREVVLTDVTGVRARELGRWELPDEEFAEGLLLVGDHVLVMASRPSMIAFSTDRIMPPGVPGGRDSSRLIDLDISDPSAPRVVGQQEWSGRTLSLRQYGETVRLVTATGLPDLAFVQPRSGRISDAEATRRNRAVVRASAIEDWLPSITAGETSRPAVECTEVLHPDGEEAVGTETLTVATFTPGRLEDADHVAVTAAGGGIYASATRLYVFATDWGVGSRPIPLPEPMPETAPEAGPGTEPAPEPEPVPAPRTRTALHAFEIDGDRTRYLASGSVNGSVRDSWSLDEHDGDLRVALSWQGRDFRTAENGVAILRERAGRLVGVGELRGLGIDEEIQSVRWFDDLAVLVTFRQVDPLYTVDLGDPERPRELGALKIPGFSAYLHPIGEDRLLGLGSDASLNGEVRGAQAAVFDIADPTATRQIGRATFGRDTGLGAAADPHDFTWLPEQQVAITSVQRQSDMVSSEDARTQGPAMAVIRVGADGRLEVSELAGPGGYTPRALPLGGDRVVLVGSTVRIVSLG